VTTPFQRFGFKPLIAPVAAMAVVIVLSNLLVQMPINDWLTWGAFSYPLVFLVTDLTNRALGPQVARRVAFVGFAIAVVVSLLLGPWRIALASGTAFIVAQLLDIGVFNRWRRQSWWKAPLIGSLIASVFDTAVFFFLAFAGEADVNWLQLAAGDLAVKAAMAAVLLAPYRALLPHLKTWMPGSPACQGLQTSPPARI
jgi:queuosine precursor transporter